ncbi:MAG: hypothetical protein RLZZ557_1243 [Bacteroidota bacterium]
MIKGLLIALLSGLAVYTQAQFHIGAEGITLAANEILYIDGLTLTSSSSFSMSATSLTRSDDNTISPVPSGGNYIKRYFNFSNTLPAFTGTVRLYYGGSDLNGLSESDLRLNIRTNGTSWIAQSELPNTTADYIESSLTAVSLNTLTLAGLAGALPVTWLDFSGYKNKFTHVLNWSTSSESNTLDFVVQHSQTGNNWKNLGLLEAAGNSNVIKDYRFTNFAPLTGNNYYRILQHDLDKKISYSKVINLQMDKLEKPMKIFPNPVAQKQLTIVVQNQGMLFIYDSGGKKVGTHWLQAGSNLLNVTGLPTGTYQFQHGQQVISVLVN